MQAAEWLTLARRYLETSEKHGGLSFPEAALETQVLLAHVLQRPRAWVLSHPEAALLPEQIAMLTNLLERLGVGEPLPYLIGHWEFFGLDFEVSPAVLIPRPETELLVEQALKWLSLRGGRARCADVGAGSGCIAVSLAKNQPGLRILATDISRAALSVAQRNASRHAVARQITFLQSSLLSAAAGPFDLVCANLPYIPRQALAGLAVADYEPLSALDGGADGLEAIRALLEDARRWLAPGGLMLLEMQYDQGPALSTLARVSIPDAHVGVLPDLSGLPRLVRIER